jgi:hypothetical protein
MSTATSGSRGALVGKNYYASLSRIRRALPLAWNREYLVATVGFFAKRRRSIPIGGHA